MEANKSLEQMISAAEIQQRIQALASTISQKYHGKQVLLLGVLKGALCLVADLLRALDIQARVEFVRCKSYRGTMQRGGLELIAEPDLSLAGYSVLVIDDIFDSGKTLEAVIAFAEQQGAASVESIILLNKQVKKQVSMQPTYSLFSIEDAFVVGYGLDYEELYRGLAGVYRLQVGEDK